MLISVLLDRMKVISNQLKIASGQPDEARAITALDMAQDYWEMVAAAQPKICASTGTLATVASTETTTWPATLLRVDALWMLATTSPNLPVFEIEFFNEPLKPTRWWPASLTPTSSPGMPQAAWGNRTNFYWAPLPDAAYTVRVYGMYSATDISTRGQTFAYPDQVSLPLAAFATRLLSLGVNDPTDELAELAEQAFLPVSRALRKPNRTRPEGRAYSRVHLT